MEAIGLDVEKRGCDSGGRRRIEGKLDRKMCREKR
jgi:hypothetical protein